MSAQIADFNLRFNADTVSFQKDVDYAKKMLRGYTKEARAANDGTGELERKLNVAGAGFKKFGTTSLQIAGMITASFGAAATAAAYLVRQNAQQAREIERMATVAQVSVERIQALAYASEQYSISGEKMSDILKDVNDKLGDYAATGGGEFKDFFEQVAPKVGLTVEKLQQMAGPEALVAVKDAMDQANIPMKQQIFYLESIANDASALMPLLENKGVKLYELTQRYQDLNVAMSEYDIEKFKQMDQKLEDVSLKLQKSFANAVLGSSKQIDWLTDKIVDTLDYLGAYFDSMNDEPSTQNGIRKKLDDLRGDARTVKIELERAENALEGLKKTQKKAEDDLEMRAHLANARFGEKVDAAQAKVTKLKQEYEALSLAVDKYQRQYDDQKDKNKPSFSKPQPGLVVPDSSSTDTDSKELERQQAAGAARLSSLDMQYANEREKLQLAHQQRLADIEALQVFEKELKQRGYETLDALKADYASREKGFYQAELQERQRNQDDAIQREIDAFARKEEEKTRLAAQEAKQRAYMEERLMQERIRGVSNFMGQISQLQNSENKNAARIGKTAARFQIMLNAYESATSAYKSLVGIPYVGPGLAAAAAGTAMGFGISMASKVDSLSNMAHNGITEVPIMGGKRESNWTLLAGERVYTNESANRIDQMFNAIMLMQSREFAFNDPISQTSKDSSRMAPRTMVNIYGAPEGARTEEKTGENGEEIINVFLADIDTDGQMSQAMTRTFGLARQGV
ncbi:hypothetical protein [Vibrio navarrensis]|uniref:hypothetical protein n=1 Tax=Vibrio navarrensis TaxID=29495 RepID=UPI00051D3753|nr:hypothetical protein [Vibrio navarrensis]KGK20956.1 hypothetical protein EA25_06765 [Vibrio navarrensis]